MRKANRVTVFIDCCFWSWMAEQNELLTFMEMAEPFIAPVEVGFTFNDGPCKLADCGRSVVLVLNERLMS